MSAWMPAPPPESDPATVNTLGTCSNCDIVGSAGQESNTHYRYCRGATHASGLTGLQICYGCLQQLWHCQLCTGRNATHVALCCFQCLASKRGDGWCNNSLSPSQLDNFSDVPGRLVCHLSLILHLFTTLAPVLTIVYISSALTGKQCTKLCVKCHHVFKCMAGRKRRGPNHASAFRSFQPAWMSAEPAESGPCYITDTHICVTGEVLDIRCSLSLSCIAQAVNAETHHHVLFAES